MEHHSNYSTEKKKIGTTKSKKSDAPNNFASKASLYVSIASLILAAIIGIIFSPTAFQFDNLLKKQDTLLTKESIQIENTNELALKTTKVIDVLSSQLEFYKIQQEELNHKKELSEYEKYQELHILSIILASKLPNSMFTNDIPDYMLPETNPPSQFIVSIANLLEKVGNNDALFKNTKLVDRWRNCLTDIEIDIKIAKETDFMNVSVEKIMIFKSNLQTVRIFADSINAYSLRNIIAIEKKRGFNTTIK